MDKKLKESKQISYINNFIHNVCNRNFSDASESLQAVVDEKMKVRISNIMEKR